MSSKLSQMRTQFREKLNITPVNNVKVAKDSNEINNNNIKPNSRITTSRTNIPRVSTNRTHNSSISSLKAKNERIGTKPTLNLNVQSYNYSTNKSSKYSPALSNSLKTNTSCSSDCCPKSQKTSSKKQNYSFQTKSVIDSPFKPLTQFQRADPEGTPCRFCGRFFALSERHQKHESVCKSSTPQERQQFDSVKQRFKGQPNEYLQLYESSLNNPEFKESKKSNWRTKHQYCIAAIRAAKGDSSGPSTAQIIELTQEQCSYCKRRFNEDAIKRHTPICAKLYQKRMMNFK